MKKHLLFVLLIALITLSSNSANRDRTNNANSWGIKIGETVILASWLHHDMGDLAFIEREKLNPKDTLFVQRYLCGQSAGTSARTLTLKNHKNEVIAETVSREMAWIFEVNMPLSQILTSKYFHPGETLSVYFSIDNETQTGEETVLLGKLRID